KLGNILIKDDNIKICELSLSCFDYENDLSYCGTRDYLAPEILRCKNIPSARSMNQKTKLEGLLDEHGRKIQRPYDNKIDIFAAGIVFKTLLSKKKDITIEEIPDISEDIRHFLRN